MNEPENLHSEWKMYYDESSGYPYYFNSVTNESIWAETTTLDPADQTYSYTESDYSINNNVKLYPVVGYASESHNNTTSKFNVYDDDVTFENYIQSNDGKQYLKVMYH